MIKIYTVDLYAAGFQDFCTCKTTDAVLVRNERPMKISTATYDLNGRAKEPETHVYYPKNSLYEFQVDGSEVERETLANAIQEAEHKAMKAGFEKHGDRIYRLILSEDDDHKIWVQIGNSWSD